MNKNTSKGRGVGRPMATVTLPNKKFTFADLAAANPNLSALTLRHYLARDRFLKGKDGKLDKSRPNPKSTVVLMDETREPASAVGLGRKTFVYIKRSLMRPAKPAKRKPAQNVTVNIGTSTAKATADYEAQKAALTAPAPTPATPEVAPAVS